MALWTVHFCIHQRKPWLSQSWSGDAGISGNNPPFNGRMSAEKVYVYYCQQFSSNKVGPILMHSSPLTAWNVKNG
jgi:hypothetical protein